jgi:TolB-like protein/Flp pilus assembly protein TadD
MKEFFAELKRRNVYKVAVAYGVVAWLLIQIATQVFPFFEIPNWAVRLVVLLVVIGFPIALMIAWAFESTPEGIKRTAVADAAREHSRGKAWIYIVIVGAFLSIGLFFLGRDTAGNATPRPDASPARTKAATATGQKSIAVLPLLNESGDPHDEYFSDGLSEELIAALAQINGLKVIGRSSSFRFKDRHEEPKAIGEKLGVSTLLEGTVRKQDDRVRIVAELINAADGIELWTRTFDRELKDIFAVQEEIARAVAESLKVTLLGSQDRPAQRGAPSNVEAHNAYLQGHFHFQRRNLEDYRKAVGYFDQAIQLDPDYALACAERSEAWTFIGDLTGQREPAWSKARSDAERAVAIAPALAEARAALGWVRFFVDWKFTEGLSELKRAKEFSPSNPTANDLLARVILYLGRLDEAERQARHAVELDPLSVIAQGNLARVLLFAGKLDEADAAARKAAELQPTSASSHRWQVVAAVLRGDRATALREAQLEPDEGYRRFELALAQQIQGDRQAADAALADLIANGRDQLAYQIAEVYAVRGEKDKAFEWLQIAFDEHDTGTLTLLVDPLLRGLRDDSRYKNLLAKLGLPGSS